jgi:hypothetical protein
VRAGFYRRREEWPRLAAHPIITSMQYVPYTS